MSVHGKAMPGRPRFFAALMLLVSAASLVLSATRLGAQTLVAGSPPLSGLASVSGLGVHLVEDQGATSAALVIDLSEEVSYRTELLVGPDRILIDLERVVFMGGPGRMTGKSAGPVSGFRAGLFMAGQSRIVLDLARPALVDRIDIVRQGRIARLVVMIRATSPETYAEQARRDASARAARRIETSVPAAPRVDSRPLVVIDPGHGGIDTGASGAKGEAEKDIVLAVARVARDALVKSGRVAVDLTRDDDRFIALSDRVRHARSAQAALFVSLHADSLVGEGDVRGASVYTLSDRASDAAAARAAEKENRADLLAGVESEESTRGSVDSVLSDLARRETRLFTQLAAREAVGALKSLSLLHKTPLRSAGFRVLTAPDVPSILIELGYLSNADDVSAMASSEGQKHLGLALAAAIERFFEQHGQIKRE